MGAGQLVQFGQHDIVDERVERGHANGARDAGVTPRDGALQREGVLLDRARMVERCLAHLGDDVARRRAIEQADLERRLERRDPPPHRGVLDPERYFALFPRVVRHHGGGAFDHDSAYRTDDFKASALWLPPGIGPGEEALGAVMQEGVAPHRLDDVFALLEQVGKAHPDEPHWFLPAIGVDPMCQGRGYGSALLERSLEACDREHRVAYLEASNPRNVPLYQRFGFEITGEIRVGDSPVVIPMQRAAR